MTHKSNVAVLGDLTALYSTREKKKQRIDYQQLNDCLKSVAGVEAFNLAKFFTIYHPNNEVQGRFLTFLKDQLDWDVETATPQEIRNSDKYTDYRFDTRIAYELGQIALDEEVKHVIVVTDSYDLAAPLLHATGFLKITVAFFSDAIDPRWWKLVRGSRAKIDFIDFEELLNERADNLHKDYSASDEDISDHRRYEQA